MVSLDPNVLAPRGFDDYYRTTTWLKDQLKLRRSSIGYLERATVPGSVVTIREILRDPVTGLRFVNTDTVTATGPGDLECELSFVPIPGSVHVYLGPDYQPPNTWTYVEGVLTLLDPEDRIEADEQMWVSYAHKGETPVYPVPPTTYDEEVLADAPYLYLKMDETSGTTAADASGNGRDFTATNVTWDQGSLLANGDGSSVVFNGATAYIARPSEAGMEVQDFTVAFRYKHNTALNSIPWVGRWLAGGSRPWLVGGTNTQLLVGINNFFDIVHAWSPVDGETYTIAVRSTPGTGTLQLLVDGIAVASANGSTITNSGAPFEIGRASATDYKAGQSCRVAWWDSYLDEDRLLAQASAADFS